MDKRTCAAPGCDSGKIVGRGLCGKHYQQAKRTDTLPPLPEKPTQCLIENCDKPIHQRGWCHMHYQRYRRLGDPRAETRVYGSDAECSVEGCAEKSRARGLCQPHYMRQYRGGDLSVQTPHQSYGPTCTVEGCEEPHHSRGYCSTHYARWQRTGAPGSAAKLKERREGTCRGPECSIPVQSKGLCSGHYAQEAAGRPLTPIARRVAPKGSPCTVEGCDRPVLTLDGLCRTHYRYRAAGDVDWDRPIPDKAPDGTGHVNEYGYRVITVNGDSVLEHRYVMEQIKGRPLRSDETVHHKKGGFKGRSNNVPSNLELWTGRHPKGHRVEDVVLYCREMLALYGESDERERYVPFLPAESAEAAAATAALDDESVPEPLPAC